MNDNEPGTAPQAGRDDPGMENTDASTTQAPGYNELERDTHDAGGDADQREPSWRPGDDPATRPVGSGMQGEGEPGRSERDSTGGVEGTGASDEP